MESREAACAPRARVLEKKEPRLSKPDIHATFLLPSLLIKLHEAQQRAERLGAVSTWRAGKTHRREALQRRPRLKAQDWRKET